jgi:hypothetical protein
MNKAPLFVNLSKVWHYDPGEASRDILIMDSIALIFQGSHFVICASQNNVSATREERLTRTTHLGDVVDMIELARLGEEIYKD